MHFRIIPIWRQETDFCLVLPVYIQGHSARSLPWGLRLQFYTNRIYLFGNKYYWKKCTHRSHLYYREPECHKWPPYYSVCSSLHFIWFLWHCSITPKLRDNISCSSSMPFKWPQQREEKKGDPGQGRWWVGGTGSQFMWTNQERGVGVVVYGSMTTSVQVASLCKFTWD